MCSLQARQARPVSIYSLYTRQLIQVNIHVQHQGTSVNTMKWSRWFCMNISHVMNSTSASYYVKYSRLSLHQLPVDWLLWRMCPIEPEVFWEVGLVDEVVMEGNWSRLSACVNGRQQSHFEYLHVSFEIAPPSQNSAHQPYTARLRYIADGDACIWTFCHFCHRMEDIRKIA